MDRLAYQVNVIDVSVKVTVLNKQAHRLIQRQRIKLLQSRSSFYSKMDPFAVDINTDTNINSIGYQE